MLKVRFYKVSVMADCEGRSQKTIARFTARGLAVEFSKTDQGRDMYGRPGDVREVEIVISESLEEAAESVNRDLRKAALSKLNQAERSALGL